VSLTGRPEFISRLEHFASVDSTQRIVREWLDAGVPEVAIARADHQQRGRGRHGRDWQAPAGAGLLVSIGFRPRALAAGHGWRLAAVVSLAMLDAAEEAAGLKDGTLWLKWPNDIVANGPDGQLLKLAGVLGESVTVGDRTDSAVIGIGLNSDWPAADFPPDLAAGMTSLHELAGGRPISNGVLFDAFLARLEPRYEALRGGTFDAAGWSIRQRTTGAWVEIETGGRQISGRATGVEPERGGLLVRLDGGRQELVDSGEVMRCRIAGEDRR